MGLADLLAGGNPDRMSLPEYMNALKRGEVERPPDNGALGELMNGAAELPLRPPPKPCSYQKELDEQQAQDRTDREEMRVVLTAKRSAASDEREIGKLDAALAEFKETNNA